MTTIELSRQVCKVVLNQLGGVSVFDLNNGDYSDFSDEKLKQEAEACLSKDPTVSLNQQLFETWKAVYDKEKHLDDMELEEIDSFTLADIEKRKDRGNSGRKFSEV